MAPPSPLGPPKLYKPSPTTTAPTPPQPESKPQGLEPRRPHHAQAHLQPPRRAWHWKVRKGRLPYGGVLAPQAPPQNSRLPPRILLRVRLLQGPAGDRVPAPGGRGREEETEGGVAGEEMRQRQEATGIRVRRRNRVEVREEENQKKERKMEREEDDSVSEVLRDRFRLSTISIADAEGVGEEAREPHEGNQGPEARPQNLRQQERRSSH